jgi:hypothetical protein
MAKTSTWKFTPYEETVELLSCPFCGELPFVSLQDNIGWKVTCPTLGCVGQKYGHPSKEDAIEDWNRRIK